MQTDSLGEYGSTAPESYWALGFIQDGRISHNFLRQYDSWTLDFTDMVYYFSELVAPIGPRKSPEGAAASGGLRGLGLFYAEPMVV